MKTLSRTLIILFITILVSMALYAIGTSKWSEEYTANSIPARGRFFGGGGGGGGADYEEGAEHVGEEKTGGGGGHNHFSEEPNSEYAFSGSVKTLLPMTMTILVVLAIQKASSQTQDTKKIRKKLKEKRNE